jgi:predicted phage-related endonuclease
MIERIAIESRAQWLELRRPDITASRIGALFSCHPYVSALRLYCEHTGLEFPDQEESPVMRRGRLLEAAVAAAVAEEHPDWRIVKNMHYYRDPELHLGATPDFLIEGDPRGLGVLQTKTAAPSVYERDWSKGQEIPFWVTLQTITEAMLTSAAFGIVAVMQVDAYNLDCPVLGVPRHAATEERLRQAVARFWDDVAHGREPPPDYGRDGALIRLLTPRETKDKVVDLSGDNELPALLEQREAIMQNIGHHEARKAAIEAEITFKLKDAARAVGLAGWSITRKTHHRNEYVVAAKDVRVLRIHKYKESRT